MLLERSTALPRITIVIPTTCERMRWDSLRRAIGCVLGQEGVAADVLAVVNGRRYDADCLAELRAMAGVTVLYRETGSAPLAQLAGREQIDSPFYGFLDDDDEYLPGALSLRVSALLDNPALDFVVTNGYRVTANGQELAVTTGPELQADPLLSLCNQNWMGSCSGLFRASTVDASYFRDPAQYMEWTYLAFRLTARLSMQFLDVPTYRINDTPSSLSKSDAYLASEIDILQRIMDLPLPPAVTRAVRRKLGGAFHQASENSRLGGDVREAWKYHWASMIQPGGARFLLYSRKLAYAWLGRMGQAGS